MEVDDAQKVGKAIVFGLYDEHLDFLGDLVHQRKLMLREQKRSEMRATLRTGDKVRFVNIRPQYMVGKTGTVQSVGSSKAYVMLDRAIGRFGTERSIGVPLSAIEVVV